MLGTTSEHALRALTYLAAMPEGTALLGRDLAEAANIPANYLSKILWALGNAGIIDATRGAGGGYRLRRSAHEIRLIDVVTLFDKSEAKVGCLLGGGKDCSESDPCAAHEAWRRVRAVYLDFLDNTTIADLSKHAVCARNHGKRRAGRKTK